MTHRSSLPPRSTKAALLALGVLVALAVAEVGLRVHNPFGFRQRISALELPVNRVFEISADAQSRSDQLDAHIIHTKNSLGFRGPEPPEDFAERLTVVAVGGSTTECFFLGDGHSWPERLAARLEDQVPDLWINNAGLDGHSTFGHIQLTRQALVGLRPNVILYLIGVNDLFADAPRDLDRFERNPWIAFANRSELLSTVVNLRRWQRALSYEALGAMPKPIALRDRPRGTVPPEVAERLWREQDDRLAAFRARLERLVGITRDRGIEPVFLTQPSLLGGIDLRTGIDTRDLEVEVWERMDGALAWRLLERYNDVTRELGHDRDVLVIDLAGSLPKDSTYFYDFFHLTNEGADAVAAITATELGPWLEGRFAR